MIQRLALLLTFVSCITVTCCFAQWYNPSKVPLQLGYKYGEALNEAKLRNYTKAFQLLDECIATDARFVDAWLSKAGIYSEMKQYKPSVELYEKAFQLDSVYTGSFFLPFSIALAGKGDFAAALDKVKQFLAIPNLSERPVRSAEYRRKCYEFALQYQQAYPERGSAIAPLNMGDSINSAASEYFPSFTIDGSTLVFTRRVNNRNEDFFTSKRSQYGWGKATPLPGDLNTEDNEGAQNIAQDGSMLVFTGCNMDDGEGSCDIYVSYLNKSGWGKRINLGTTINTEYWESQPCLSPDKRSLYFTARDPSGFGGSDLFVSHLQPNGRWGTPRNMGPQINTSGDESCPFIHPDNQTLYFTSNGHPGYGGTDLFLIRRQPGGGWSTPQNLGYPVNTIDDEGSLVVASDGKTAYFASDGTDSRGGLDIYTFELPVYDRPFKTFWVTGNVFDVTTKQGLPSAVELIDLSSGEVLSKVQTNEDGRYLVTLPTGKNYAFNVNRKGYLFFSEFFELQEPAYDTTYVINIPLTPLQVNASVVLRNIFFDTKQSTLKPESMVELDRVAQLMADNPSVQIEITGHTDNVGKPADNQLLSANRARSVVNYLLSKGIAPRRLSFKGMGATQPVAPNTTDANRARNRRTELRVTAL